MQLEELKEIMRSNGIAGAGGAGFPSYMKLNKNSDTVILNCAECEPLLKLHRQLIAKYAYEIMWALDEIRQSMGAAQALIAIKDSYKSSISSIENAIRQFKNLHVKKLKSAYPAGDEFVTIYETTGRIVPPGKLPASVGVTVYNTETVLNVYNALKSQRPVTYKHVTVAGEVAEPKTIKAAIGTEFKELVKLCGGETIKEYVYINGGPMMGKLADEYDTVTKTTNAILVLPTSHPIVLKRKSNIDIDIKRAMSSCCQCESCTSMCPRYLLGHPIEPHAVMRAVSNEYNMQSKEILNSFYCSQCGLCELYSCPQGLSPRKINAAVKASLIQNGYRPKEYSKSVVPVKDRALKKVPSSRLTARLGLSKYNIRAPLTEGEFTPSTLKISLTQNIGKKSVPCVKIGDFVEAGGLIADVGANDLGLPIHSPADGFITDVTDNYITIKQKEAD